MKLKAVCFDVKLLCHQINIDRYLNGIAINTLMCTFKNVIMPYQIAYFWKILEHDWFCSRIGSEWRSECLKMANIKNQIHSEIHYQDAASPGTHFIERIINDNLSFNDK